MSVSVHANPTPCGTTHTPFAAHATPAIGHGGRLRAAIARYGGPPERWIDLSTAIAPWPYPLPPVPPEVWQRLPEPDDALPAAITAYYRADGLPIPGTQAALQILPTLFPAIRTVVIPTPSYGEYRRTWALAGRLVRTVPLTASAIDQALETADALVLGQPNNPTGHRWSFDQIRAWHERLARRHGLLVIDEAFADAEAIATARPSPLPAWAAQTRGAVVLRSLGKFFGLAGLRFGVAFGEPPLIAALDAHLGPWAVSHPARWAATLALSDTTWQKRQLMRMQRAYHELATVLAQTGWLSVTPSNPAPQTFRDGLFPYAILLTHPDPEVAATLFATRQILVRSFPTLPFLRVGIAPTEQISELRARLLTLTPESAKVPTRCGAVTIHHGTSATGHCDHGPKT